MTKRKIIASNIALQVFPNINVTKITCEPKKITNLVVASFNIKNTMIDTTIATIKLSIRPSLFSFRFLVIQCQSKRSSFPEGIDLRS